MAEFEELQRSGDKAEVEAKLNEGMGKEHSGFVRFHGRGITKTALKHRYVDKETTKAQMEQEKELRKAEVRQEYSEQLHSGLNMTVSLLQQLNPTFIIPPNIFDFLLPRANPDDGGSAPRNVLTSSGATNSPTAE